MSQEQDAIFVRNFSLVLVFLAIVGITAFILAKLDNSDILTTQNQEEVVAERLVPVGSVNVGEPFVLGGEAGTDDDVPAVAESGPADPGKSTYGKICFACHDAGVGGAPKYGDKAAWADRLQKGPEMLVSGALNGFQGSAGIMPPKGGLTSLTDDEVRAAVMYILAAVDESTASAATAPMEAEPMAASAAPEVAASEPVLATGRGKEVYDAACFICHATGVAGAPKFGDASAWTPRVAQGADTLYTRALKGFMGEAGLMPPKGGRMDFSDDDVKAAVDYMVDSSE